MLCNNYNKHYLIKIVIQLALVIHNYGQFRTLINVAMLGAYKQFPPM